MCVEASEILETIHELWHRKPSENMKEADWMNWSWDLVNIIEPYLADWADEIGMKHKWER